MQTHFPAQIGNLLKDAAGQGVVHARSKLIIIGSRKILDSTNTRHSKARDLVFAVLRSEVKRIHQLASASEPLRKSKRGSSRVLQDIVNGGKSSS